MASEHKQVQENQHMIYVQHPASQQNGDESELLDIVRALWEGRWKISLSIVAAVMLALAYLFTVPKSYQTKLSYMIAGQSELAALIGREGLSGSSEKSDLADLTGLLLTSKDFQRSIMDEAQPLKLVQPKRKSKVYTVVISSGVYDEDMGSKLQNFVEASGVEAANRYGAGKLADLILRIGGLRGELEQPWVMGMEEQAKGELQKLLVLLLAEKKVLESIAGKVSAIRLLGDVSNPAQPVSQRGGLKVVLSILLGGLVGIVWVFLARLIRRLSR